MELLDYLYTYFFSEARLIQHCDVELQKFIELQTIGVMPRPSYILDANLLCNSFFGEHEQHGKISFYPKSYAEWLNKVKCNTTSEAAFTIFSERLQKTIHELARNNISMGYEDDISKLNLFIATQWQHFLEGTYGLCTRTGLPEDIAKKEITIGLLNTRLTQVNLSDQEEKQLITAMNLLASCSPKFAPHERSKSQKQRLAAQVESKLHISLE
ncbi:DUF6058 family natural product biosynthesis protein [Pseudoalteromonas luteoviolacea]|uniref:Uncharacterized protein n=1 Tax=Pseudoalteromonas luteoviolacea DSM 6061 TaxID=1365250 RepID=A0A166Z985_9GAMM|nr:DUF6058 family natural product biosynthesis protein [Pseudoalteromonas luteoviolacea]KZN44077.1 hypothetical protein N475_08185 [Pseudoalteromonas luteoviolacea DSM 6061]MBE0386190.1 hypothetical protein [Pseudoalteromonas luteoviolacea DSM 6061]